MTGAALALADGTIFRGTSVGADGLATGEVVFNTAMSGYQEIATDPSYAGQVVVLTAPHIGNYGVSASDAQAAAPSCTGFVMRATSRRDSSWRSEGRFSDWLRDNGVVAISEVDTRRLTRHIRSRGAMPAAVGAGATDDELRAAAAAAPSMEGQDLTRLVSTKHAYRVGPADEQLATVVAYDFGIKRAILSALTDRGLEVHVVPAATPWQATLDLEPDAVFLSNGPGDPEPLFDAITAVRGLLGRVPLFGICLGHQVLGLALGASTFKLGFGHHGGNHPVRRLSDGKVFITSQNHGFAVDLWSLAASSQSAGKGLPGPDLLPASVQTDYGRVDATHQNLNDGTLEGLACRDVEASSVQYHPEAAPGPNDAVALFDQFAAAASGVG